MVAVLCQWAVGVMLSFLAGRPQEAFPGEQADWAAGCGSFGTKVTRTLP